MRGASGAANAVSWGRRELGSLASGALGRI